MVCFLNLREHRILSTYWVCKNIAMVCFGRQFQIGGCWVNRMAKTKVHVYSIRTFGFSSDVIRFVWRYHAWSWRHRCHIPVTSCFVLPCTRCSNALLVATKPACVPTRKCARMQACIHVCVHAFVYVDLIYVWPYTLRGAYHVTSDTSDKVVSYLWNLK